MQNLLVCQDTVDEKGLETLHFEASESPVQEVELVLFPLLSAGWYVMPEQSVGTLECM